MMRAESLGEFIGVEEIRGESLRTHPCTELRIGGIQVEYDKTPGLP